ncbi:MAG: hypothetical protein CSB47_07265 [Proteobacteria bacterium]|nr:MAG: hypothetical protein CSB47_07265 [Pseudomonadota bacterium]
MLFIALLANLVSCGTHDIKHQANVGLTNSQSSLQVKIASQKVNALTPSFPIEVSYPYVLTGNMSHRDLLFWKAKIQRIQGALRRQLFAADPDKVITIWLFKDAESYTKYNRKLWSVVPPSNYGYYQPPAGRMAMNVGTGSGTLLHEIVHPYIEKNFPESPLWFNEGLASLYERSSSRFGRVLGLNNWRLGSLQAAIRSKSLMSLQKVMRGSDRAFYGINRNLNYAQARYLMFYLQSKGLLVKYYTLYRDNIKSDPFGIQSLLAVTGYTDMSELEVDWRQFVLKQRY